MKNHSILFGTLLSVLILMTCCGKHAGSRSALQAAEKIVATHPDSALNILLTVDPEELRSKKDLADYNLLLAVARDKTGSDPASVEDMSFTRHHYRNSPKDSLMAVIHYYLGRSYEDNGEQSEALKSFLKAKSYSDRGQNKSLSGLIYSRLGRMYHKDFDFETAEPLIEKSIHLFEEARDTLNAAISYELMGRNLVLDGKYERALAAYEHAENLYLMLGDTAQLMSHATPIANIHLQDLGNAYLARQTLDQVYDKYGINAIPSEHYILQSVIEAELGNYPRALELLNEYQLIEPDMDVRTRSSVYYLLSFYSYSLSDFRTAYEYLYQYIPMLGSIYDQEREDIVRVAEKKYERNEIENEYKIYRQRVTYGGINIALVSVIVIILLVFAIARRNKEVFTLEADLDGLRSQMSDFEDMKHRLSTILDKASEKEIRLQQVLNDKILQLQKIVDHLFIYENNPEEFKKKVRSAIVQAEKDQYFGELHEIVNQKYHGIVDHLKSEYPDLSEDEINMCCLICFGFNNNQISILFGHTNSNSIFNKRHKLRKKLGLWPKYESLETYLSDTIENLKRKDSPEEDEL